MQRLSPLLRLAAAVAALAAATLAAAFAAPAAQAATPTKWVCKPGATPNPCAPTLDTTVVRADGGMGVTTPPKLTQDVDCFYVYPTVSGQQTTNANLNVDPEVRAIAEYQASRYSQTCRVYAPVYRQLTLKAIATPRDGAAANLGYKDVQDAWREYLRKFNKGRGVILIGHSQGTYMLRELVKREIDRKPAVRKRLVAAHLLGGNVTVKKGSDRGGDFKSVPACRRAAQTGCVVAYSMFDTPPPADARFGRTTEKGLEVLCTNPASLGGGNGALDTISRTEQFPGTLGLAVNAATTLPKVGTTWVAFPGRSTGRCVDQGGAQWLQVDPAGGPADTRPLFKANLGAGWGLHLGDVNIALGNLVNLAASEARAYTRLRAG
ncbi:MAG TPA: DUF3089 domain-containing protein [Solirubrobacteraceae bacterium]|nr:DUF3089 domain-containing protein [Solirubrobacteraceae bacterium]